MAEPSALDLLRARYAKLAGRPTPTFHLPVLYGVTDISDGEIGLLVEYREPGWLETQDLAEKWGKSNDQLAVLNSAREQLAQCVVDVWTRDDEHGQDVKGITIGKWLPGLGQGDGPVGIMRAAKLLEVPAENGLQAVAGVLVDDWQVMDHHERVAAWQPGPPPEVGEQFVGESQGPAVSAT
jgi:hypothetical protein